MALYRALSDLDTGKKTIKRGEIFLTVDIGAKVATRLEEMGKISRVAAPPLEILPGFKAIASKMAALTPPVTMADEFIETGEAIIADACGFGAARAMALKRDVLRHLIVNQQKTG